MCLAGLEFLGLKLERLDLHPLTTTTWKGGGSLWPRVPWEPTGTMGSPNRKCLKNDCPLRG